MAFKKAPHGTTRQVPTSGTIISGKPDAIFLRNKYQTELDNAHASIVNMVHYIEDENKELKEVYNRAQGLKRDIEAHEKERANLYDSLGNLLNKETDFEKKMWETTQKGRKVKSVTIKQKFKDSDIEEMRYDSMLEYLKQYPEYASKSTFKKITEKIDEKEREIRFAKKSYHYAVSRYNHLLSLFEKNLTKADDKFVAYDKVLQEGEKKLSETRYRKSMFYKLASEKTKAEVNLDTLQHRVEQFRHTLDIIKREHSQNKSREFVEMEY